MERIYAAIRRTEYLTCETYPQLKAFLPEKIHFIHAEELLKMYPDKTPKEREDAICEAYGAVFVIGIGGKLSNGEKHDGRAPDYDDWSTIAENGKMGLNGDILIWYPILGRSFELSSMGIRVDKESLLRQLKLEHKEEREQLYFHQQLLCRCLSAEVSVRAVSVWCCSIKVISVRSRPPSGPTTCARPVRLSA